MTTTMATNDNKDVASSSAAPKDFGSADWNADDFDVFDDGVRSAASTGSMPPHLPDQCRHGNLMVGRVVPANRTKSYGRVDTREEAMAALRAEYKRWLEQQQKA